ncbi:MAG: MFS transporter [Chloroflexota bacterium]|nr:MFS transporter [Chloroflexota bacterium]
MSTVTAASGAHRNALSYPNYRRYWVSAVMRIFGFQFQFIGMGWLVAVELDRSPFWLGTVWLANAIPTILLSLPGGSLADRSDPYRLMVGTQFLMVIGHTALAVLILTGLIEMWMVIAWAVSNGVLWAVAAPAMNTLLPRLIEPPAMSSAVALISGIWSALRIVGPASAGVLIALVGTGHAFSVCAAVNGLAFIVMLMIRLAPRERSEGADDDDGGIMAGLRFVFGHPVFLATIGLSFFTSVFGSSYVVLLPIFANDLLEVGSEGFGFMEAMAGIGSLVGTWWVIRRGLGRRPGVLMLASAAVFGVLIAAFATTDHLAPASVLLLVSGFAAEIYLIIGMTTVQLLVPDGLRGRVMGIWSMTYFLASVGGFIAGFAAEFVGVRITIAAGALSVTAFALTVYFASAELRRLRGDDVHPPGEPAEATPEAAAS